VTRRKLLDRWWMRATREPLVLPARPRRRLPLMRNDVRGRLDHGSSRGARTG